MTDLDALLAQLRERSAVLAKSQPAVETAPAAAAPEVPAAAAAPEPEQQNDPAAEADADAAAQGAEDEDDEAAGGDFGKAIKVTDAEGNEHDGIDGFALIKALQADIDDLRAELATLKDAPVLVADDGRVEGLQKSFVEGSETLAKSLVVAMDGLAAAQALAAEQAEVIKAQDARLVAAEALVKSLGADVAKFGAAGSGRRAAVTVHERPSAVPVAAPVASVGEVFAKAQALNAAGKLTSIDVARVVARVNSGVGVPAEFAHLFAA